MAKRKIKKGKTHASKIRTKNSNRKIKLQKRKSRANKSNSRSRKGTKKTARRTKTRLLRKVSNNKRAHHKKKIRVEQKFWNNRKRRTVNPSPLSRYATKSLVGRDTKKSFKIKKKMKQTRPLNGSETSLNKLSKESTRYLNFKNKEKSVYLKALIRDSKGNTRWISVTRQPMQNFDDVEGAWGALFLHLRGGNYGDSKIIGYEVEQVI